jgi:hypothetical protein
MAPWYSQGRDCGKKHIREPFVQQLLHAAVHQVSANGKVLPAVQEVDWHLTFNLFASTALLCGPCNANEHRWSEVWSGSIFVGPSRSPNNHNRTVAEGVRR